MVANSGGVCRTKSESRIPLAASWGDVMKAKDETASSYIFITDLAAFLRVRSETIRRQARGIGVTLATIRNANANNTLCRAVTAPDAKRIIAAIRKDGYITDARVLTPDEISKLMEEA